MPSISNTTPASSRRSHNPPACSSFSRGRATSLRETMRAEPRQEFDPGRQESGRASNALAAISPEQRHECVGKRLQTLVERFQGAFAADCISQEDSHKVDDLIVSEAATSKAYRSSMDERTRWRFKTMREQSHFPEPAGQEGTDSEEVWILTGKSLILLIGPP